MIRPLISGVLGALAILLFAYGVLALSIPARGCTVMVASYYGLESCKPGKPCLTANGEKFTGNAFTAAHRSLPFGTKLKVTYKGKSVVVRLNDRGPWVKGRTLDLSIRSAKAIGMIEAGVARVCTERLN